jgi:hypothetical protein
MGLGQGNGAAPPGFLAVCTLMINVYCNLGQAVMFIGAWERLAFTLPTFLYVDNSDLIHMAIRMPSDEEFLQLVQSATNDWVGLVHATGGLLKPQKCFWYMLGWIWKKGKARLKTLYELPQNQLYIPQPDGTRVPIHLKAISDPEKKLDAYTCLLGNFSYHVAQLLTTGSEYAERLGSWRLWQGMPGWVCAINCSPNLSMGLLQLLSHRRNWKKYSYQSGMNCYPPFVLIGTSLRSIECSRSSFRVWPFQIPT